MQKVFIVVIDNRIELIGYSSLKGACEGAGIGYSRASKMKPVEGERVFVEQTIVIKIVEIEVQKIKGRGTFTK